MPSRSPADLGKIGQFLVKAVRGGDVGPPTANLKAIAAAKTDRTF